MGVQAESWGISFGRVGIGPRDWQDQLRLRDGEWTGESQLVKIRQPVLAERRWVAAEN
jgi:hypothetical protein